MSSRCKCPFSGPSDTILGCHRDPIISEKGWFDFAVRELSRVAAGKARGQEAVWRSQCKPDWWDCECPCPWKNPTANPKDSKDTLKVKFECLVKHLRKERKLPREMEEEIGLWENGHKSEVFLMTTFSSLLGQASNLHTVAENTCHRMEESGISVDISIVTDLQRCLNACVEKLESIKDMTNQRRKEENSKANKHAGSKRRNHETGSDVLSQTPCKRFKASSVVSPHPSPSSTPPSPNLVQPPTSALSSFPSPSQTPSSTAPSQTPSSTAPSQTLTLPQSVTACPVTVDQSKMLLAVLQKQVLGRKVAKTAVTVPSKTQLKPKAGPVHSSKSLNGKKTGTPGVGESIVPSAVGLTDSMPPTVCLTATLPKYSAPDMAEIEFTDFLALDLGDNNDDAGCQLLNDSQFLDNLLQEACPDVSGGNNPTKIPPCSVPHPVSSHSPIPARSSVIQNETVKLSSHDPFFGHCLTTSSTSESTPFHFDVLPEGVAERQLEVDSTEGGIGTVLFSYVGGINRALHDTGQVSDSGYSSESSVATPHRSSLDSDYNSYSDLNSPDLEAFLDSF